MVSVSTNSVVFNDLSKSAHHFPKNCSAITRNHGDHSNPDDGAIIAFSSSCVTYLDASKEEGGKGGEGREEIGGGRNKSESQSVSKIARGGVLTKVQCATATVDVCTHRVSALVCNLEYSAQYGLHLTRAHPGSFYKYMKTECAAKCCFFFPPTLTYSR